MYQALKEPIEDSHYGYNRAFVRSVMAKRRGAAILAKEPLPIKAKVRISSARQIRSALAFRATNIHRGTAMLEFNPADAHLTPQEIIRHVADEFGVTVSAICGKARGMFFIAVRHRAIARLYLAKPDASLSQIAKWFNRDHTTVLHAVQKAGVWRNPGSALTQQEERI